jgi:uncharacterized protein YaaQ
MIGVDDDDASTTSDELGHNCDVSDERVVAPLCYGIGLTEMARIVISVPTIGAITNGR